MGNICRKTDKDPDSAWRQQNIEVATNPMYQYCNFTNGGKLLDAYNAGGIPAVEKLAKTEIATFLYNNGEGATINKIDFIKWKSRCEAKITNSTVWETKSDEELLREYKDDPFMKFVKHDACWDLEKRGGVGETPFHLLYLNYTPAHLEIAKCLLRLYPKMALDYYEGEEYYGESALHIAIIYGDLEHVKLLIECGANVNERAMGRFFLPEDQKPKRNKITDYEGFAYYGEYPLAFAACYGHEDIYDYLIDHGADPDLQDQFGNTVLHMVVVANQVNMYKYCVRHTKKPAKTYIENNINLTPLTLASKLGRHEIFKEMLELGSLEFWRYSHTTCSIYPLLALDSIGPTGETNWHSALMIIINGDRDEHLDMLEGGVMRQLLDEKWEKFAKRRFFQRLILAFLHLALITIAVYTRPDTDFLAVNGVTDVVRFISEIFVCIGCVIILAMEVVEIGSQGIIAFLKNCGHAPAHTLFMVSCILFLACIPFRFLQLEMVEDILLILAVPGAWLFLLFFARSVKLTGPFVTMIYKMLLGDLLRFGVIYSIFLLSFTQAFYFLFQASTDSQGQGFGNLWDTIMTLFQMTLGEFKYQDFNNTKYSPLTKMVFAVFMILVPILLLNMLIAMMGNTYNTVIQKSEKEWRKQWAKIVVVLERGFSKKSLLAFQREYSVKLMGRPVAELAAITDSASDDRRALVVIKSSNKTIARRRKAACGYWKRAGKEVMKQIKRHRKLGITGPIVLQPVFKKKGGGGGGGGGDGGDSSDEERGHMFSNMLQQLAWEKDIDLTKGQQFIDDPDIIEKTSPRSPDHRQSNNHVGNNIPNGRPRSMSRQVKTPGGTPRQSPKLGNRKFNYNRVSPLSVAKGTAPMVQPIMTQRGEDSGSEVDVDSISRTSSFTPKLHKSLASSRGASISEIKLDKRELSLYHSPTPSTLSQAPSGSSSTYKAPPPGASKISWEVPKSNKTDDESLSPDESAKSSGSETKAKPGGFLAAFRKNNASSSSAESSPKQRDIKHRKKSSKERKLEDSRTSSQASLIQLSDCKESEL